MGRSRGVPNSGDDDTGHRFAHVPPLHALPFRSATPHARSGELTALVAGCRSKRRRVSSGGDATDSISAAIGGAGEGGGKKALYHCNYCNKDISGKIRIKCSKCPDFDLCVECFSVGAEVTPHRSNHPYRVMVSALDRVLSLLDLF